MWYKSQLRSKGDDVGNRIKSSDPLIGDNAKAFLGHSKVTIRQGRRGGGGGGGGGEEEARFVRTSDSVAAGQLT